MRPVYISTVSVLVPGSPDGGIPPETWATRTEEVMIAGVRAFFTRADYDAADPRLPRGREGKLLRRDVAAALLCVARLLERRPLDADTAVEAALFLATGLSQDPALEQQIRRLSEAYIADSGRLPDRERNAGFFRMLPPLMALSGLSNISASLIAQTFGIRGENTVFGVTSHAGSLAVQAGYRHVARGRGDVAVVGGANAVGILSALAFSGVATEDIHEAEGAAFLLLESEKSLERAGRKPLCRLTAAETIPIGADSRRAPFAATLEAGILGDGPQRVLHGGAVFRSHHEEAARVLAAAGHVVSARFDMIGGLGAASAPCDVAAAANAIANDGGGSVFCLDRDIYGRETVLALAGAGEAAA